MVTESEIRRSSILVVDDQDANVTLLEKILHGDGYSNVTSTTDSQTVSALHAANRYDLIILDLQMPVMDGFQVMEQLKEIEREAFSPVLVITAQPGHKLRALESGARDFISKPFDLVEVKTRIRNMLEVQLLNKKLARHNAALEKVVQERTAELRESEARFRGFTELSSDWYWEQDAHGVFTVFSGTALEALGVAGHDLYDTSGTVSSGSWNEEERAALNANIAARRPFLDFVYSRTDADGRVRYLQVSGQPVFDAGSRFTGYRGVGLDITARMQRESGQHPQA